MGQAANFSATMPTQYRLKVAPLWDAMYSIEAGFATVQEAKALCISMRDPCLIIVRRTVYQGTPITLVRPVHPGSRYRLEDAFSP
jgi:GntR family histidine utilization transcriptional repressor